MTNISWEELRNRHPFTPEAEAGMARLGAIMELEERLYALRERQGVTQSELARRLDVSQANVSRIEHETDLKLSTLRGYIEALGGELELHAIFPDGEDIVIAGPHAA